MGLNFRKRIKILPGVSVNISKSGVSTSVGTRGASVNVGKRGTRATVGIPGTGLSHTQQLTRGKTRERADRRHINEASSEQPYKGSAARGTVYLIVIALGLVLLLWWAVR